MTPAAPGRPTGLARGDGGRLNGVRARVVSAVVLIAIALGASWAGGIVFGCVVVLAAAAMAWEWGRMVRGRPLDLEFWLHFSATAAAIVVISYGWPLVAALGLVVVAAAVHYVSAAPRPVLSATGILVIGFAAIALVWLRADPTHGFAAVLFVMVAVWSTDTFAMLTGKAVGGPLLFESVSPRKTWSGAIGGLVAAIIVGAAISALVFDGRWSHGAVVAGVLSVAAQIGDLLESAVKRACKVKNTSELIPGHGGVLDRMDGLIGAALVALAIGLAMAPGVPARGLIFGS